MSTRVFHGLGWVFFAVGGLYGILGAIPSAEAVFVAGIIVLLAASVWLRRDATAARVPLPQDWGWFIGLGWPFVWIWYGRRTKRSWSASLALAAMPLAVPLGTAGGLILRTIVRMFR